jgi:hypothetical protein
MKERSQGAQALALGLLCWGLNVALIRTVGAYGVYLVILGALGVFFGSVLLVWGASFRKMPVAQQIPAALIALAPIVAVAMMMVRWAAARP